MPITVVVEAVAGRGFVARTGDPYNLAEDGATEQEAVEKLRQRVTAAKVITLDIPAGENPWRALAGYAKDVDPEVWAEHLAAIEEYRRQIDADEDRP